MGFLSNLFLMLIVSLRSPSEELFVIGCLNGGLDGEVVLVGCVVSL